LLGNFRRAARSLPVPLWLKTLSSLRRLTEIYTLSRVL